MKKLPAELRRRLIEKVEEMTDDLAGDVKQLANFTPEYRLRVGDYRVLFEIEGNTTSLCTASGIAGTRIDEREAAND